MTNHEFYTIFKIAVNILGVEMTDENKDKKVDLVEKAAGVEKLENTLTFEQAELMATKREEAAYQRGLDKQKGIFEAEKEEQKRLKIEQEKADLLKQIDDDQSLKDFAKEMDPEYENKGADFLRMMVKVNSKNKGKNTAKPESQNIPTGEFSLEDYEKKHKKAREERWGKRYE